MRDIKGCGLADFSDLAFYDGSAVTFAHNAARQFTWALFC